MAIKTLNAGCGCDSWGDIRIDIEKYSPIFYLKNTSVNLIASVEYLPFRNDIFTNTRCFHVLEHTNDPYLSFRELKRVTKESILIRVPVHHIFSYMVEFIAIFKYLILSYVISPSHFLFILSRIKRLKLLYSSHKWYIRGNKINWVYFFIPLEYEIKIDVD